MLTSLTIIAEGGITWTPELYYLVVPVVQLVVLLVTFRLTNIPAEYNTFINGVVIVAIANLVAYFTLGLGIVGILLTGLTLFVLLAGVSRGDVFKSLLAWVLMIAVYWVVAYFMVPAQDGLEIEHLGGMPQMLMEGGLEAEPMTTEDYENLRDGGGDD